MAIVEIGVTPTDFESFDVIPDSIYGSGADGKVFILFVLQKCRPSFLVQYRYMSKCFAAL